MKIQKLNIHHIASLEDAVIDFEASPLAESEVFLITGITGSGKSTILDAICLALYADTPRLDGTKMDGGTKDGDSNVSIDDPRQLMRKNTGEAFASLTFIGSNGTHYKATWSVARAYKKPTGNLQPKEWVWENLDTKKNLAKDAEIKKEIELAIGLDFEQFRRTTLLAQGEFTRFLNSPDKEKAAILEKITGVDVYSKIGKKIYDVTSKKESEWENAKRLLDETHNPSDEEIQRKKEEIKSLDAQQSACKRLQERDKVKLQWIKDEAAFSEKLALAQEDYQNAVAETESEAFMTNELLARQWNDTMEARSWLKARKNAQDDAEIQKDELRSLAREYANVLAGLSFAEQQKNNTEVERDKLPEVKPEEEIKVTEELKDLRQQRDDTKDELQNMETAMDRIESYVAERKRREQTEKSLKDALDGIEKKKEEALKTEPRLHDAKVKMDAQKEMLDKQKDTIDKFAKTLRQKLKVGDVCPVCRQEIKGELPHEAELAKLVAALTEEYAKAETAYKELEAKKNKLDAEIKAAVVSYQKDKEAFDNDNSVAIAKQKVIAACKACGIEVIEKNTPQVLESMKAKARSKRTELDTRIKGVEKLVEDYRKTIRQREKLDFQLKQMAEKCQTVKEIIDDILLLKPEWKTLAASVMEEMPNLVKKANDLKSMTSTALAQLEQAEKAVVHNSRQLEEFLQSHADLDLERLTVLNSYTSLSISEMKASLDKVRNKVLAAKTLQEEASEKLEGHKLAKPALEEKDTVEALESRIADCDKTMTGLAEKKGALNQELITDEKNKERYGQLSTDADTKKKEYLKWERMNQYIGDSTGSKFRKIAQSYVLASLIRSANSYMNTLTDRYTLKVTPGTFVISIEDAYQGFASRAVSTISGGESFLVSLSLALALSDIGQRLSVDILFIDEGFGTLSGTPLQNAINTLRALHSKAGRHVGIISHVEELKNKNLVQIVVR